MDEKLACLAFASNTAFVSKNFPMNKSPSTNGLQCFEEPELQKTRLKSSMWLQISFTLLETPLIRNI